VRVERRREKPALRLRAAQVLETRPLRFRLDARRRDGKGQRRGQPEQGGEECRRLSIRRGAQAGVELEPAEPEAAQGEPA
jgi:hypothetical protein